MVLGNNSRIEMHQLQQITIMPCHNQSTPSQEEDLQEAVETLRSTSSDFVRQQNKNL